MLNPDATGPNLTLSTGNLTVTNKINKKWNACRATTCFSSGMHSWEVHVDKCVSKNIFIGVMGVESSLDNYVGSDKFGWGYLANKAIWHNKGKVRSYGELFKEGDTIGVHLDMDVGNLWFSRNGRDLGIAVEGLHGELYPAFSLYNKDDQLSLVPPDCGNGNATYSIIGGTALAESTIHRMAQALNLLEFLPTSPQPKLNYSNERERAELSASSSSFGLSRSSSTSHATAATADEATPPTSAAFAGEGVGNSAGIGLSMGSLRHGDPAPRPLSRETALCVWQRWRRWQKGNMTRILTAHGTPIDVETSAEVCSVFGLFHGEKVKFNKGLATVLGVAKHCLWYSLDGSAGAMCWSRRQAHEIVLHPTEYQVTVTHAQARKRPLGTSRSDHKVQDDVTVDTMLSWFDSWTPEMDAQLCEHVNALVEAQGSSPFHLVYSAVEAPSSTLAPSLVNVQLPQMQARMALLVHLNDLLNPLLPLIDFSLTRNAWNPAHMLCLNRYRLFSSIKGVVLGKLLQQTATPTQVPKDEYSEPPDLPKIVIETKWGKGEGEGGDSGGSCRRGAEGDGESEQVVGEATGNELPLSGAAGSGGRAHRSGGVGEACDAAKSALRPSVADDHAASLWPRQEIRSARSCFGQVCKQLSGMLPSELRRHYVLRRSFVDDAQECAFRVAFSGQTSHDQGAAYRSLFRRVCAEVQSQTVPLFVPCPNSIKDKDREANSDRLGGAAVGSSGTAGSWNRKPLYMVNLPFCVPPGQTPLGLDPGRIALYRSFGQLMGIALRTQVPLPLALPSIIWRPLVGEDLSRDDLMAIDSDVVGLLEYFEHLEALGVTSENFEQLVGGDLRFVAPLSDGSSVELMPGGRHVQVQYDNARHFASLLERARLGECIPMVAAIYEGLISVVPRQILPLFTWRELELLVCGRPLVDVSLLHECACYGPPLQGSEPHILLFWNVLEESSIVHRTALLRLLWSDRAHTLPNHPHLLCATTLPAPFRLVSPPDATVLSVDPATCSIILPTSLSSEALREQLGALVRAPLETTKAP